jgi:predicted dehydrogenase
LLKDAGEHMTETGPFATVALYGVGGIGIRHLQGLARLGSQVSVVGIDTNTERVAIAAAEWASTRTVGRFTSEPADATEAQGAILATPARGRLDLVRQVLATGRLHWLILEKVVFQSASDFALAEADLQRAGTTAFVNCPRRLWPIYRVLQKYIVNRKLEEITIVGRDWGLACNGIHFLDLFQLLSGEQSPAIESTDLHSIIPAKRAGYHEVLGRVVFRARSGARIALSASPDGPEQLRVGVRLDDALLTIDEGAGTIVDSEGLNIVEPLGRAPYQSELTGDVVSRLIRCGTCDLASLSESGAAHEVYLAALGDFFTRQGIDVSGGVPIT